MNKRSLTDLGTLLDELEDRYDGAPDSHSRWMAEHIENLRNILRSRRPT